ncbi:MAG TPA: pseudouridine synthase [Candidatus Obscuribacterales bacterium]
MRLNRAIASTGICSRREADVLISEGRVTVNGQPVTDFSCNVDPRKDKLLIDGKPLFQKKHEYIVLYKPKGVITTCSDERGRKSVLDLLPPAMRHLKPVGRLDRDSEGMLILTNDGELAHALAHPSRHVSKIYRVTVQGKISERALLELAKGVRLSEGMTQPAQVRAIKKGEEHSTFEIVIKEGKNRQIRRMCAKLGYHVTRLVRVGIGALQLRLKEPGEWRHLKAQEVGQLLK